MAGDRTIVIDGVTVPRLLYGTAWKEDRTEGLVTQALAAGFRGVDTANQRKHYFEAGAGAGIQVALKSGAIHRANLFIQTKYTYRRGQDDRLPYDEKAPVATQVRQSCDSSLEHLGIDAIDSYLLHGPATGGPLTPTDWQVWRTMEALHKAGKVRLIGVSNFSLEQLKLLCARAEVPPRFIQNRCYANRLWDKPIRDFCAEKGIRYQGFSLLTANRGLLAQPKFAAIVKATGMTPAQVIFRFALDVGMVVLTGTTSAAHMAEDLKVFDLALDPAQVVALETLAVAKA